MKHARRLVRKILLAGLAVIAALLLVSLFLPGRYRVQRSIVINAKTEMSEENIKKEQFQLKLKFVDRAADYFLDYLKYFVPLQFHTPQPRLKRTRHAK